MTKKQSPWYSDWSSRTMLLIRGSDGRDFLQRLSTNDMGGLDTGPVRTILTNEKGRIVDILAVVKIGNDTLLLAGVSREPTTTKAWLERYIIMEDISVEPADEFQHILVGREGAHEEPSGAVRYTDDWGTHYLIPSELSGAWLAENGMVQLTEEEFERDRIIRGIPEWKSELSEEYNPLEARLGDMVSWTKGCYIGQEVIARLDTYKKVQRIVVRLIMNSTYPVPSILYLGETNIGTLTSVSEGLEGKYYGIGYMKTSAAAPETRVKVGSPESAVTAKVREH